MEQFMWIGGMENEREPDDLGSQQCEGRHAIPCFPEIFNQGKLGIGKGADQSVVHVQVLAGGVEIFHCQAVIRCAQIGIKMHVPLLDLIVMKGCGYQVRFIHGFRRTPFREVFSICFTVGNPLPL